MTGTGVEKDYVYIPKTYAEDAKTSRKACDADFDGRTVAYSSYCEICKT